ncbi:MAG: hypothetical protein Tsb0034_26510 [Ekhidna sp.]
MEIAKNLILDDYYKLRITSKRLSSGRYQVKFYATVHQKKEIYGYLLVESNETLKTVIAKIRSRLKRIESASEFAHFQLYHVGQKIDESNFLIFQ